MEGLVDIVRWEDREVENVSRALLFASGRISVDELVEGLEGKKALSIIAPFQLDRFDYTARAANTLRVNISEETSVGVVVPTTGSRRQREDFVKSLTIEAYGPIIFHERTQHPTLDRWLPYMEQAEILVPWGWYHAAGWEFDIRGVGKWTRSLNIGESS